MTLLTKWRKVAALLFVLCLHVFFVMFSLSRALQRGKKWQKAFIAASIVQMIIEVFVYETTECIWLHYVIPSSIRRGDVAFNVSLVAFGEFDFSYYLP
jgi:hypothetical protein